VISFEPAGLDDPAVLRLYADFIREADDPLQIEVDVEAEIAAGPPTDLTAPDGVLFLVRVDGEPAGLGGVRHLDTEVAEVKSMYVVPARRGRGVGHRIIAELERVARERGCRATRLDTSEYLTPAVALYRSAGYAEVPDYNGNLKADLWFERALADEPILLVPYDPAWPGAFEKERSALEAAIGAWATGGVHHVGSTAVPGLEAKPIVDILVGVESLESAKALFEPLAQLEYLYAPYRSEEMHWFCKPGPALRTHHLHLAPAGGRRYAEELAFRDRLRADPHTARAYAELKRDLAARFGNDRDGYTEAKSDFIRAALGGAQL
jgi:GrpB-like predicted nucleotidyltransferase (UPF0157 family)/GNAT superfamily N-acetyltransferase